MICEVSCCAGKFESTLFCHWADEMQISVALYCSCSKAAQHTVS